MAMNVKFLKGVKKSLPTTRDSNTLYFVTDEGALYLGATLIGADFTSAIEAANAAIKAINDHGYVNSTEVGTAIGTALESYYTKSQIDSKIGTLKIGDTSYNSVVDYVVAKTTGIATDAVVAEKADKIAPVKPNNIAVLTTDGNLSDGGKTIDEVLQTAMTNTMDQIGALNMEKSSAAVEAGKGIQVTVKEAAGKLTEVSVSGNYDNKYDAKGAAGDALEDAKDYTDEEITGLEFALSEDGKTLSLKNKAGTAVATLDTTDFVVDGMLSSVVADQTNNKLTFTWNTDSGIKETVIELSSIADIYTGSTNADEVNVTVSNTNVISATVGANVKADIVKGVTAHGWGNHASQGYLKAADIAGKEDKSNLKALAYKDTIDAAGLINNKVITKEKLADAVQTSLGLADTSAQKVTNATAGHLAALSATGDLTDSGKSLNDLAWASDVANLSVWKDDVMDGTVTVAKATAAISADNAKYLGGKSLSDIQGQTTNSIKDCVDAINALNAGTAQANKDINAISTSVNDVVNQLTWGTF